MNTKGQIIAKIRQRLKEVSSDSMYSNRGLWNDFYTEAKLWIKRDADGDRKIYKTNEIWTPVCLSFTEVSPLLCTCVNLPLECKIYRSTFKVPPMLETSTGPLYRMLATVDNSYQFVLVTPNEFQRKIKIRYNRGKYAFIFDGYLWTNQSYPRLILSAVFEDIEEAKKFSCNSDTPDSVKNCGSKLSSLSGVPDYIESLALRSLMEIYLPTLNKMTDNAPNTSESQREVSL